MIRTCPRCASACAARHHDGIEVDLCAQCGGVLFDKNELDRLVSDRFSAKPLESLFAFIGAEVDDPIDCPACGHAMHQLVHEEIEFDRCPECEAIWVDGHERGQLAQACARQANGPLREERVLCDGCGEDTLRRQTIVRAGGHYCEACLIAGNHPGPEAALVGINDLKAAAAVSLAKAKIEQERTRAKTAERREIREKLQMRRYHPIAYDLMMLEAIRNFLARLFGRR